VYARAGRVPTGLGGIALIPEQTLEVRWLFSSLGIQFSIMNGKMREGEATFSALFTAELSALRVNRADVSEAK
jgi:hypothetical protein